MPGETPFPLCWPAGVPRTTRPQKSPFRGGDASVARPRDLVVDEVEKIHGRALVISTNIQTRVDGSLRADGRMVGYDAGVAVYFTHPTRGRLVIAVDKFKYVSSNLWAIGRTLEVMRQIRRWGTNELADQALGGFAQLPHITPAAPPWMVLQFAEEKWLDTTIEEIEVRARELSKRYHPDSAMGGDAERFKCIREALAQARRERGVEEGVAS